MNRIATPDGQISALDAGPATAPGVVLIHGLGWDGARLWAAQVPALVMAGWRVLVPDLRGTGASAPLVRPVTITDLASDLVPLLDAGAMTRPVLVGFSMGCMVAMDLALRPAIRAAGVILACGGLRATATGQDATEAMLARAKVQGAAGFAAEQAQAIFGPAYQANHPGAVQDFIRWRAAMDQDSLHHAFRAPDGCDYMGRVAGLPARMAVIAADNDGFLPLADARALADRAQAALHIITGSGHMAPVERPAAFTDALLRALKEVTA